MLKLRPASCPCASMQRLLSGPLLRHFPEVSVRPHYAPLPWLRQFSLPRLRTAQLLFLPLFFSLGLSGSTKRQEPYVGGSWSVRGFLRLSCMPAGPHCCSSMGNMEHRGAGALFCPLPELSVSGKGVIVTYIKDKAPCP